MKVQKAYFFVITPLHYLNALEAKKHFNFCKENTTLIILSDYKPTVMQMNILVDHKEWGQVVYLWASLRKYCQHVILYYITAPIRKLLFDSIIKKIEINDIIFWGNYNSIWLNYLVSAIRGNTKIYLLDDGFATITLVKPSTPKVVKSIVARFELFIMHYPKPINLKEFSFFTNYNLKLSSNVNEIVFHNYSFIKQRYLDKKKEVSDTVYFIGQPLVEQGYIKSGIYVSLLTDIFSYYRNKGLRCFYLPHRSSNLNYIPKEWNILVYDSPLEFQMLSNEDVLPKCFVTFYSSACYNLNVILENFDIQFHYWIPDKEEFIINIGEVVYNYLNDNPRDGQYLMSTKLLK